MPRAAGVSVEGIGEPNDHVSARTWIASTSASRLTPVASTVSASAEASSSGLSVIVSRTRASHASAQRWVLCASPRRPRSRSRRRARTTRPRRGRSFRSAAVEERGEAREELPLARRPLGRTRRTSWGASENAKPKISGRYRGVFCTPIGSAPNRRRIASSAAACPDRDRARPPRVSSAPPQPLRSRS
jgi:hypothetical protein